MKFHVHGDVGQATVHLELKNTGSGKSRYRYLFVDVAAQGLHPPRRIILIDNRAEDTADQGQ